MSFDQVGVAGINIVFSHLGVFQLPFQAKSMISFTMKKQKQIEIEAKPAAVGLAEVEQL